MRRCGICGWSGHDRRQCPDACDVVVEIENPTPAEGARLVLLGLGAEFEDGTGRLKVALGSDDTLRVGSEWVQPREPLSTSEAVARTVAARVQDLLGNSGVAHSRISARAWMPGDDRGSREQRYPGWSPYDLLGLVAQ